MKDINTIGQTGKDTLRRIESILQRIDEGKAMPDVIDDIKKVIAWSNEAVQLLAEIVDMDINDDLRKQLQAVGEILRDKSAALTEATKYADKSRYSSPAVKGIAPVTVTLASGTDAAVYIYKDGKTQERRKLSARAVNAIVYITKLMPASPTEVTAINSVAELAALHTQVTLNARDVGAFVRFLFGRNTAYTRREFIATLSELSQPVTTRVAYKKGTNHIVINEVGNVRLVDVHPFRRIDIKGETAGKTAQTSEEGKDRGRGNSSGVVVTDLSPTGEPKGVTRTTEVDYREGIIISVGRLFYLDAKHYIPVDIKKWGTYSREYGKRFTRVMQKLLPKGEAIYAAKRNGGNVRYLFSDEDDFAAMALPNKTRRRKECADIAAVIAEMFAADSHTVDRTGITLHWEPKGDRCKKSRNCANRDKNCANRDNNCANRDKSVSHNARARVN